MLGAGLALAGCTALPAPLGDGPLVSVRSHGGRCVAGECDTTVTLDRSGKVHAAAKPPNELGTVDAAIVQAIDALIRTTDFAELRKHPFTGTCPTDFDGQELVYAFTTAGGTETIASCEVEVDPARPLFAAVAAALGPFVGMPAP